MLNRFIAGGTVALGVAAFAQAASASPNVSLFLKNQGAATLRGRFGRG